MPPGSAITGSITDAPLPFVVVVQAFAVYEVPERVSTTSPDGMEVIVLDTAGELVGAVLVIIMLVVVATIGGA